MNTSAPAPSAVYTNPATAAALDADVARKALADIALILDGDPNEPGKEWSSDEIEGVAQVIHGLGFYVRPPGQLYKHPVTVHVEDGSVPLHPDAPGDW